MTKRIELSWDLDGLVDEQRYYCSETSFTDATKPTPKAILLDTDRTYIDTDIDYNKTYYVAVSSVRNTTEKLSEVKQVSTVVTNDPFADYVVLYMPLDGDFTQVIGSKTITQKGTNNTFATGGIGGKSKYVAGNASYFTFDFANFFGTQPFCIEYYAETNGTNFDGMSSFGATEGVDYATLTHTSASYWVSANNVSWTSGNNPITRPASMTHFAFCYDGSSLKVYIAGVLYSTIFVTSFTQTKTLAMIGKKSNELSIARTNSFQHLRITRGVARYTANFTPPTEFIY